MLLWRQGENILTNTKTNEQTTDDRQSDVSLMLYLSGGGVWRGSVKECPLMDVGFSCDYIMSGQPDFLSHTK